MSYRGWGRAGTRLVSVAALAMMALLPARGSAQGWIEPRAGTAAFGVEKLRTSVSVRIQDRVATVEVEEWFRNNGGALGEGDYVYPLPGEAVFSGYSLYQGDQELRGEMMDAQRARGIYEQIVRSKRDPALIELVGRGMLRARVFPIEPGQTRRITLRYTQVLERSGDALQFRYLAGVAHRGSAVTPVPMPAPRGGRPLPPLVQPLPEHVMGAPASAVPLDFRLVVERAAEFGDAFSPTHALDVERAEGRMNVRPRGALSGEFAVFLPLARRTVGLTLAAHRLAGEAGYFMLTLSPGEASESRVARDVTVVVDVSGSMSGEKIEQARRALHQLLGTLTAEDRFRLVSFSSAVRVWREDWTRGTRDDIRAAARWVDELSADGGTNIHAALEDAFSHASPASRLPVVVFLTDGVPTNGETAVERIVGMAESRRGRARIFAFGVGYDVNTHLLDRLSEATRGSTQYVRPGEDVESTLAVLATKIRHPVLTDLALERNGLRITELYPRQVPDLFAGEELVLFGRYEGSGTMAIAVTGQRAGRSERFATDVRMPARQQANDYIPRLWAARKAGDLDRRIRSARADGAGPRQLDALVEELRVHALRYGLLSEYTAYLVLEPGVMALDGGRPAAPAMALTGAAAVARADLARQSSEVASMADARKAEEVALARLAAGRPEGGAGAGTRIVAGRTFEMASGTWQDVTHRAERRIVHVEPYSRAYFDVIAALPELAQVLRELTPVLVAGEGVSIRVAPGGVASMTAAELRRAVVEFRSR